MRSELLGQNGDPIKRHLLTVVLIHALATAALAPAAAAWPDRHCPPGQERKGLCTSRPEEPDPQPEPEPEPQPEPDPEPDPDPDPQPDPEPDPGPVPDPPPIDPDEPVRAFPGAEGAGANTIGGRGGQVIKVTNLDDSGTGSLRACVEASMPRICVFETGGTIHARDNYSIKNPYLTVAGQTAPGGGITIRGAQFRIRDTHDVVVRYLRVRVGDQQSGDLDGIEILRSRDVILDHVSASWSIDETISLSSARDVTIQWSIISEPLNESVHSQGRHGFCIRAGASSRFSLHHNLMAHCFRRSPEISKKGDYPSSTQVVNNVMYGFTEHATKLRDSSSPYPGTMHVDIVANRYLRGLNEPIVFDGGSSGLTDAQVYLSRNVSDVYAGDWAMVKNRSSLSRSQLESSRPHFDNDVTITDASTAYEQVLDRAGATVPVRDAVDQRVVANVRNRTGKVIDSQDDVGGWPALANGIAPQDRSGDGIPDDWASAQGLDPTVDNAAGNDLHAGYTNIEVYINSLVRQPG